MPHSAHIPLNLIECWHSIYLLTGAIRNQHTHTQSKMTAAIVGGHAEHFNKASQCLLDLLADLAEDLAERSKDHSEVEDAFKQATVHKESVRAQSIFLQEQLHKSDLDLKSLKIQITSLKEASERSIDFSKKSDYVAFKERVWNVQHPDLDFPGLTKAGMIKSCGLEEDQEFSVTGQKENLICSITQKQFVDPHRSTCGHVFEKEAIDQMLQGNRNIPCPIAGCRANIARKDLKPDASMKRRLEQIRRKRI